jgi:ubiquinone/menaquinone biosynthesis C-methylase UbiE
MISQGSLRMGSVFDFGKVARQYDQWYATPGGQAHDRVQKMDVRHFLGPAGPGARLLDIGCGTGHWSRFFATLGYTVTGIDIALEMVQFARGRKMSGVSVHVAEATALPFQNASFDVVAAMATLEFVTEPEAVLREMARCVTSSGRMLVGSLNRLADINRERLAEKEEPYLSGRLYSPDELAEMLRPFGSVRMIASESENDMRGKRPEREEAGISGIPLKGPLIVAEVHR